MLKQLACAAILIFSTFGPANGQTADLELFTSADERSQREDIKRQVDIIKVRPETKDSIEVRLNPQALMGDQFGFTWQGVIQETFRKTTLRRQPDGEIIVTASSVRSIGEAILVIKDGSVTGTVRYTDPTSGLSIRVNITPLSGDLHVLVLINLVRLPADHAANISMPSPEFAPYVEKTTALSPAEIDIAVVYTASVKAAYPDIEQVIQASIAEGNVALGSSYALTSVNIAALRETRNSDFGKTHGEVLQDLIVGIDPAMSEVKALRRMTGADVVVVVVSDGSACGQATQIGATADTAFVSVNPSCLLGNYTLVHELGHLMGARHDVNADPSNSPFSYGHGYVYATNWRTIMAYGSSCNNCPRLPYLSTPNVRYQNVKLGTSAKEDVARVFRERSAILAGFRDRPALLEVLPERFSFSGKEFGPFLPNNFNIGIRSSRGTISFEVRNVPTWLVPLEPLSGSITFPQTYNLAFRLSESAAKMAPGLYSVDLRVANLEDARGDKVIPVNLTIAERSFQRLLPLPQHLGAGVNAISSDGAVQVGYSCPVKLCDWAKIPAVWRSKQAEHLEGFTSISEAVGVNRDGTMIIGNDILGDYKRTKAIKWINWRPYYLQGPKDGDRTMAHGISDNGFIVVGESAASSVATIWRNDSVKPIVIGRLGSKAYNVSGDGSVVVGVDGYQAAKWTGSSFSVTYLPCLPTHQSCAALSVNADGTEIVGFSASDANGSNLVAVIWRNNKVSELDLYQKLNSAAVRITPTNSIVLAGGRSRWTSSHGTWMLHTLITANDNNLATVVFKGADFDDSGTIYAGSAWFGENSDQVAIAWKASIPIGIPPY